MALTQQQIDNIQIDFAVTYLNYGEVGERLLGPTRGGGEFKATGKIRDIEFDGQLGKNKGTQVIEEIAANLKITILDMSMDNLALSMPYADYSNGVITAKGANVGVISDSAYLKNVTTFCKTLGGAYKKITLYNAMSENDFELKAKPKGEGELSLEIEGHWDPKDANSQLYKIEDVQNISGDVTKPTVVTVPVDAATAIVVTSNLTVTFSKDIKQADIIADNFMLVKAADGSIVAGALTYTLATKTVTLDPTASLSAATPYILTVSRVRDLAGNVMLPVIVNFVTA